MSNRLKLAIGTLAGTGLLPAAPGTWGSLFSLLILYPVALQFGNPGLATAILAGSAFTLWTAEACEKRWGPDPSRMVIDEFAGQAVVFLFISFHGNLLSDAWILIAGFLLFRVFDVFKPFGINRLQHVPSGFGILLDDLLAGLYALACLQSGIWLLSVL